MTNEHTAGTGPDPDRRAVPLSAAAVAAGKVSRSGLHADGTRFRWTEGRPTEGGRQVVVADAGDGPPVDVTPAGVGVRSRVHEYGGGAAWATPVPLTPEVPPPASVRYADGSPTPSGRWVVCVEERLEAGATSHRLVAVATDGSLRTLPLVTGGDFVAAPRVSPAGDRLAWVTWDHPSMPWDVSALRVASLEERADGIALAADHRVAGGVRSSVGQPHWTPGGDLLYVDDRTGWWLPYRLEAGAVERTDPPTPTLVEEEAEFHAPDWSLGQSTLVPVGDGSVVCRVHRHGADHLVRLVPPVAAGGTWDQVTIAQPCVSIAGVAVAGDRLAVLGATPTAASVVVEVAVDGGGGTRRLSAPTDGTGAPDPVTVSPGTPFVADTPAGPVPGLVFEPVAGGPTTWSAWCHRWLRGGRGTR